MRCKMTLISITEAVGAVPKIVDGKKTSETGKVLSLHLYPVYHQDNPNHENTKFWAATPSGELKLNVVNAAACDGLEVGGEYYVDITPAKE